MAEQFEPQFWCVWREDGGQPTVKHQSYQAAKAEAMRLARHLPGQRFVVLAAAAAFIKDDVKEVRFSSPRPWSDDPEIPF